MKKGEIKKADNIWKAKVKENAGYRCELCGKKQNECQLHPHHYIGRRNKATRWYLENGICLCASQHTLSLWSAHQNPEWFRKEMLNIRGDKWLKDIIIQSNKVFKGEYTIVKKYLDGEIDNYC